MDKKLSLLEKSNQKAYEITPCHYMQQQSKPVWVPGTGVRYRTWYV
tara:strand:- start:32440 stop:32577 length:138 start_codon:yes stop_codon:yes gene_type:complete